MVKHLQAGPEVLRLHVHALTSILLFLPFCLFMQPLGIRPLNLSVAFILITLFNFIWVSTSLRLGMPQLLGLATLVTFLVGSDLVIDTNYRGTILANFITSVVFARNSRVWRSDLLRILKLTSLSCLLLAIIASYRYFLGYVAPGSENEVGLISAGGSYFYLGISYLPATRNSDAFYFLLGFLCAVNLSQMDAKFRYFHLIVSLLQLFAILLSLSRGVYIAALLALALFLPKRWLVGLILLTVILIFVPSSLRFFVPGSMHGQVVSISEFVANALVSLIDSDSANRNVSGRYTYSNSDRMDIYTASVNSFLNYPFGQGVDNVHLGIPGQVSDRLHSENFYLDLMVALGVFSIPVFLCLWIIFWSSWKKRNLTIYCKLSFSLYLSCALYALFNSPMDLAVFWYALMVASLNLRDSEIPRFRSTHEEHRTQTVS